MRPLKLRMAGLRSYRAERTVDFTDLSLVAIIGPTGAGKSSLLEGITYALYGASTWDKTAVKELISDAALSMRVSLEFEADGQVWQVTRMTPRKAGASSHGLVCLSDPEVARVDGDTLVNARVKELIGLDYGGFCACVLLPQGKFEQLLKATKRDRARVLKGILRLDELEVIRSRAGDLSGRLTPRCDEILDARAQFLPDPAQIQEQAAIRERELQPRREELERAKTTVDALIEQVGEHRQIAREAEAAAGRVDELVDEDLMERLRTLAELDGELSAELRTAVHNAEQAKVDAEAAERTVIDLRARNTDSVSIINAQSTLASAREDLTVIAEEQSQLANAQRQLTSDRATHTADTARLAQLAATVIRREAAMTEVQQSVAAAKESFEFLAGRVRATVAAREALEIARREEQAKREQHTVKVAACKAAIADLEQARIGLAKARAALAEGQRADLAAQIAHQCHAGDPCPICARTLPDAFVAPMLSNGVNTLQDAVVCAEEAEQAARRVTSAEEGAAINTERGLNDALEQLTASIVTWGAELSVALPGSLSANTVELDEATTARLQAPQRAAEARLETAQNAFESARSEYTRLQVTCETTESEHERRARALAGTAESLERRRATVNARLLQLPSWIKHGDRPGDAEFDAAAELLVTRLIEAEHHERTATSARQALTSAQEATHAIETRIRTEVHDLARVERTTLVGLRAELARHQLELAAAPEESASIADLIEWTRAVLDAGGRELRRLRDLAQSENEAAKTKTDLGRETVAALGFDDSRRLQEAVIEITAQEIAARREREQAAGQLQPAAQLDSLLVKARRLRDGLNELARQLADAKFVGFVVERRQRALLTSASGILSEMTVGQFGFTEDFQIIDRRSGMARSPDTLSGGETFLASLALALGLVELAGRSGGRLQALFLDEGFGSLDPEALDQALNELEHRAQAGRLIALISHVPAVAERIDQILHVTKTPQGSDIHLLTDAERQALLLDDATDAVIAAQ